jgi:hypothetical protein
MYLYEIIGNIIRHRKYYASMQYNHMLNLFKGKQNKMDFTYVVISLK